MKSISRGNWVVHHGWNRLLSRRVCWERKQGKVDIVIATTPFLRVVWGISFSKKFAITMLWKLGLAWKNMFVPSVSWWITHQVEYWNLQPPNVYVCQRPLSEHTCWTFRKTSITPKPPCFRLLGHDNSTRSLRLSVIKHQRITFGWINASNRNWSAILYFPTDMEVSWNGGTPKSSILMDVPL